MRERCGIKLSSGNVEVCDLENANIQVESRSGNIKCGNVNTANMQASSGNIQIRNAKEANLKASSRKN